MIRLLSLALVLGGLYVFDADPRVLLFAFIAFLQASGREISPWVLMGPLIVLKHGFELRKRT